MEKREILIRTAIENKGSWSSIAKALSLKKVPSKHIQSTYKCITIYDWNYPMEFRRLRYPPWVLFYEGNLSLLEKRCMTIVGSRELSEYGKYCTEMASKILSEKFVIVSGLAKGADARAHLGAIENGGKTIGVIASGLDYHYPKENEFLYQQMKKEHLILSEYPPHTMIQKHHFVWRNRILAALGEKCIVTSAKVKSGTMLTVNEAMNLGKEVWCFPYPICSEEGKGCNKLIGDGAFIIYDPIQFKDFV